MDKKLYETYVRILNKELVTAMGCTEPIAIAYAGSLARKTLGGMPNKILIEVSGNIIKNVKSVIVPHTHTDIPYLQLFPEYLWMLSPFCP